MSSIILGSLAFQLAAFWGLASEMDRLGDPLPGLVSGNEIIQAGAEEAAEGLGLSMLKGAARLRCFFHADAHAEADGLFHAPSFGGKSAFHKAEKRGKMWNMWAKKSTAPGRWIR